MKISVVAACAWLTITSTAGLAVAQTPSPAATAPGRSGDPDVGTRVVKEFCSACHGSLGRGTTAPSIVGPTWRHGSSDSELRASIRDGYPGLGMPPFNGVLSDQQIRDVIAFIRRPISPNAARGPAETYIPPDPLPTGVVKTAVESYRIDKIAKVERPYAFAFLPDGRILITQADGRLRMVEKGRLLAHPVAGTPQGDPPQDVFRRQLLDVAPHPDYARNGWIYLSWAMQQPGMQGAEGARLILSRGRIREGRWIDDEELIRVPSLHTTGGRIAFDGQGHLFLTVVQQDFLDLSKGSISPAQDVSSPMGKILRLNDDGSIPADNPFVGQAGAFRAIWSLGHRVPMGLAFDRRGRLWETENGPRGGDELNLIRRGANYGWPTITWGHRYDDKPVSAHPEQAGMEQPVVNWSPTPAVAGMAFYTGEAFPRWKDSLFIASLKHRSLLRVVLNEAGRSTLQEVVLYNIARMRDVRMGPDGALYVLTEEGDLLRLRSATE